MNKLISFHFTLNDKGISLECSNGQKVTDSKYYGEILDFLVDQPISKDIPRTVWSLTDLVKAIEPFLPREAQSQFKEKTRNGYGATWIADSYRTRIFFQPDKFFSINRRKEGVYGDNEVTFYELEQFFPDRKDISTVQDVQKCADKLTDVFSLLGVNKITNLSSPVRAIEESGLLDEVYKTLPDPAKIPPGCQEYATLSNAYGAWCSAYQVGYWQQSYSYDIASAYPFIASNLLSLEGAEYKYSKSMICDANYGFVKGTLTINPEHPYAFCSPIVKAIGDDEGNPAGKIKDCFTLGQVKFIEKNGMGRFELKDGHFIFCNSKELPFHSVMHKYYEMRSHSELASMVCKRVIAGIIGRLGQFINDEPTKYTNAVYHSLIKNTASLIVAKNIMQNGIKPEELLHVNTDGFHTTRKLDYPQKASMGAWRGDDEGKLIVLSPDDILEGDKCDPVLEAINADKKNTCFLDYDLMALSREQNRYFPKFPTTGGELLKNHYQSEAIAID